MSREFVVILVIRCCRDMVNGRVSALEVSLICHVIRKGFYFLLYLHFFLFLHHLLCCILLLYLYFLVDGL